MSNEHAEKIREAVASVGAGKSRVQVARELGVTAQTVGRWVAGANGGKTKAKIKIKAEPKAKAKTKAKAKNKEPISGPLDDDLDEWRDVLAEAAHLTKVDIEVITVLHNAGNLLKTLKKEPARRALIAAMHMVKAAVDIEKA